MISQKPDVTLYEAMNFLDRFVESFPLVDTVNTDDAQKALARHRGQVNDLIGKWNKDPANRDKAYLAFKELVQVKDEMVENLNLILERDNLIDEGLVKAAALDKQA